MYDESCNENYFMHEVEEVNEYSVLEWMLLITLQLLMQGHSG